jgi:hypothetical protein
MHARSGFVGQILIESEGGENAGTQIGGTEVVV